MIPPNPRRSRQRSTLQCSFGGFTVNGILGWRFHREWHARWRDPSPAKHPRQSRHPHGYPAIPPCDVRWRALAAMTGFDIIVADPPWRDDFGASCSRATERHYQTMTLDDICAYPVPAAKDSLLFLWTTTPMLVKALGVMAAWGFTYRTSMVWDKRVAGTGKWVRGRHELILIGRRGKFPAPQGVKLPESVIESPRRRHSEKPEALQDEIERVYPGLRYLELFARRQRVGWTCFGDESESGVAA